MRKWLMTLPLMVTMGGVDADVCKHDPGQLTCGKGRVNSCQGQGRVVIDGTQIDGLCHVQGDIQISHAQIMKLVSQGALHAKDSQIKVINHQGVISLAGSHVGELSVESNQINILSSHVDNCRIRSSETAHVHVTDGSEVKMIQFEGQPGSVYCAEGCRVDQVLNGEIKTERS